MVLQDHLVLLVSLDQQVAEECQGQMGQEDKRVQLVLEAWLEGLVQRETQVILASLVLLAFRV